MFNQTVSDSYAPGMADCLDVRSCVIRSEHASFFSSTFCCSPVDGRKLSQLINSCGLSSHNETFHSVIRFRCRPSRRKVFEINIFSVHRFAHSQTPTLTPRWLMCVGVERNFLPEINNFSGSEVGCGADKFGDFITSYGVKGTLSIITLRRWVCEDYKSTQEASAFPEPGTLVEWCNIFSFGLMDQPEKLIPILDINSISLDDNPMPKTPFALTSGGAPTATAHRRLGRNQISIFQQIPIAHW